MTLLPLLRAEVLKLKGSRLLSSILVMSIVPIIVQAIYLMAYRGTIEMEGNPWRFTVSQGIRLWMMLMLPICASLVAVSLVLVEQGNQQWKLLLTHPVERSGLFLAKLITGVGVMACMLACLIILCLLSALPTGLFFSKFQHFKTSIPWVQIGLLFLRALFAVTVPIAISLWISLRWPSLPVALGVGMAATMLVPFMGSSKNYSMEYGWLFPWAVPLRLMTTSSPLLPVLFYALLLLGIAIWMGLRQMERVEG